MKIKKSYLYRYFQLLKVEPIKVLFGVSTFTGMSLFFIWMFSFRLNFEETMLVYKRCRNRFILKWLIGRYGFFISDFKQHFSYCNDVDVDKLPIWIFWYQGEKNAPAIVKACINSVKSHAGNHNVHIITKENLYQYLSIPQNISIMFEHHNISITNFSDYVRLALLYEYGGLWIDATVYVTKDIDMSCYNPVFDSIKIPPMTKYEISDYKWTSFYLFSYPKSDAMFICKKIFEAYWNDGFYTIINYLFIDFIFEMLYVKNKYFKAIIDNKKYEHKQIYSLQEVLNNRYDEDIFNSLTANTSVFKLSYKFVYINNNTFYSRIRSI